MSLLPRILESKAREVEALKRMPLARAVRSTLDVPAALRSPSALRLIAEVKFKSPSAGPLSRALDVQQRVEAYAASGAAMISVLCDGPFFDGSWDHLAAARAHLDARGYRVPLLAKEFVVDEVQIARAHASGADAVLLIARIVSRARLVALSQAARHVGLEAFVEVVTEEELESANEAGARVIGVNARDLDTLVMDAERAARVLAAIRPDAVAVHLSGLKTPGDVRKIAGTRADAALIGEVLMREDDPRALLASLVRAAARE